MKRSTTFWSFVATDVESARDRDTFAMLTMPAPCDECPLRQRCANERLACSAFVRFVRGSTTWGKARRDPSAELYRAIMREDHEGHDERAEDAETRTARTLAAWGAELVGTEVAGRRVVDVSFDAGQYCAHLRCPSCGSTAKYQASEVRRGDVAECDHRRPRKTPAMHEPIAWPFVPVQPCAP